MQSVPERFLAQVKLIEEQITIAVGDYKIPTPATTEEEHYTNQDKLADSGLVQKLENIFETAFREDRSTHLSILQSTIAKEMETELTSGRKYAIVDVDSQVDFLIAEAALCPPLAISKKKTIEHILYTMATLAAAQEVIQKHPTYAQNLEIVSSQDAHRFNRDPKSPDALIMNSAYGNPAHFDAVLLEEKTELSAPDYVTKFAGHCVIGTIGAEIFMPIKWKLVELRQNGVNWVQFGKGTFSGPKSGVLIKNDLDISCHSLRNPEFQIFDDRAISYNAYFKEKNFFKIYLIGICADVCVKQAALALRKVVSSIITVIEAGTFYLNATNRPALEKEYRQAGVGILKIKGYASNGDDVPDISRILAFYLRYPKACNAVLNLIAISVAAIVALTYAVSTPIVATAVVTAAALAAVGVFYTRPAAEHKTLVPEITPGMRA